MRPSGSRFALFATLIVIAWPAYSQELRIDLGVSLAIDAADGTPANDIPGAGVLGRYTLDDQWAIGVAVNRTEYDYEEPAAIVGIVQDPTMEVIDALAEATTVRAWIERSLIDQGARCASSSVQASARRSRMYPMSRARARTAAPSTSGQK